MAKYAHIEDVHRRIFAAMLAHMDDSVGAVLSKLRQAGVEKHTLIVFLSDNGGPTKELTSSNAPLRGGKGELREGGIRVPFLMAWKGTLPAGRVVDHPVSSMDASATALDAAGLPLAGAGLDGLSLRLVLTGTADGRETATLFWRLGKMNAIRHGDWKLIRNGGGWQLFNLTADAAETTDLATKEPQRVDELSRRWEMWNAGQVEPLWK